MMDHLDSHMRKNPEIPNQLISVTQAPTTPNIKLETQRGARISYLVPPMKDRAV